MLSGLNNLKSTHFISEYICTNNDVVDNIFMFFIIMKLPLENNQCYSYLILSNFSLQF